MTAQLKENDVQPQQSLPWFTGVKAVFKLEMKQRLRARSWYIVLGIWFALLGLIFVLAAVTSASMAAEGEGGPILFELVIGTVLLFGLLVAPGLSATAINGDRAAGTLAIIQVTLLAPGQILWGKWLTAWAAALAFLVISLPFIVWALIVGGVTFSETLVSLVMLAVELGLVAAIGVGVSAIAGRPLFSIVITYMLVALLSIGTVIGFGLSMVLVQDEAEVTTANYSLPEDFDSMAEPKDEDFTCTTETYRQQVLHTERTAWLLAANPFVIVADAVPYNRVSEEDFGTEDYRMPGVMESVSIGLRTAQAGPDFEQTCEELSGPYAQSPPPSGLMPIWPLGLALQGLLAGALIFIGWRRLATPVGRLPRGTRIA